MPILDYCYAIDQINKYNAFYYICLCTYTTAQRIILIIIQFNRTIVIELFPSAYGLNVKLRFVWRIFF